MVASPWLGRTWEVSSCCSSLPWPWALVRHHQHPPFCSSLLWVRVELSPWGLPLIQFWLSFTRWVHRQLGHRHSALCPLPEPVQPRAGPAVPKCSQLPCTHGSHCRGSSGSAAKPAVTGYWAPTNLNVMFTAHTEVPHGLQAVFSWLRARRETTPAAWWAGTSSPAADQAGRERVCFCL